MWRGTILVFLLSLAALPASWVLSTEVLVDGGEVDGGAGPDALGVLADLEESSNPTNRELQPDLAAPRRRLLSGRRRLPSHNRQSQQPTILTRAATGNQKVVRYHTH